MDNYGSLWLSFITLTTYSLIKAIYIISSLMRTLTKSTSFFPPSEVASLHIHSTSHDNQIYLLPALMSTLALDPFLYTCLSLMSPKNISSPSSFPIPRNYLSQVDREIILNDCTTSLCHILLQPTLNFELSLRRIPSKSLSIILVYF